MNIILMGLTITVFFLSYMACLGIGCWAGDKLFRDTFFFGFLTAIAVSGVLMTINTFLWSLTGRL